MTNLGDVGMNMRIGRPDTGRLSRIGTLDPALITVGQIPLKIPEAVKFRRWPLLLLMSALGLALIALIGDAARSYLTGQPSPAEWRSPPHAVSIVLGGQALSIPFDMIIGKRSPATQTAARIDLALNWPSLTGHVAQTGADGRADLPGTIQVRLEADESAENEENSDGGTHARTTNTGDGTGLSHVVQAAAGGLFARAFVAGSAHEGEEIVYESALVTPGARAPFAARCRVRAVPAPSCLRRVIVAPGLRMTYRFPRAYLTDWGRLDRKLRERIAQLLVR